MQSNTSNRNVKTNGEKEFFLSVTEYEKLIAAKYRRAKEAQERLDKLREELLSTGKYDSR